MTLVARDVDVLCEGARRGEYVEALRTAEVVAAAVARTRDWVNTPPGDLTPAVFADAVAATHAEVGGATGYSNVWAHASDARTYVPQPDLPTAVAP